MHDAHGPWPIRARDVDSDAVAQAHENRRGGEHDVPMMHDRSQKRLIRKAMIPSSSAMSAAATPWPIPRKRSAAACKRPPNSIVTPSSGSGPAPPASLARPDVGPDFPPSRCAPSINRQASAAVGANGPRPRPGQPPSGSWRPCLAERGSVEARNRHFAKIIVRRRKA